MGSEDAKGVGVVGALLVFLALILAIWPDAEEPEDQPFEVQWPQEDKENPLAQFQDSAESRKWIPGRNHQQDSLKLEGGDWDLETAKALLQDHEEWLRQFERLAAQTEVPWQWRDGKEIASFAHDLDYLSDLQRLGRVAAIHAKVQAQSGEALKGVQTALDVMKVGAKLKRRAELWFTF